MIMVMVSNPTSNFRCIVLIKCCQIKPAPHR